MNKNILLVFLVLNCATFVKSYAPKHYSFSSTEIDTSFYVNGEKVSETILEVPVPDVPNKTIKIRAEKTGFKPEEVELRYQFNPAVHFNGFFLIFYPVGVLVDYLNDSFYHYSAERDFFYMQKDANYTENPNSKSYIDYETKKENLKDADGYLATNLSSKIISIARFENGKYIELSSKNNSSTPHYSGILPALQYEKNMELDERIGFLTPGKYRIKTYFSYTAIAGRYYRTYEGKANEAVDIEIFPSALTVLCTDFDPMGNKTLIQLIQSKVNPDLRKFSIPVLQNSGNKLCPAMNKIVFKVD